jgi:hypothetical protein
MPKNSKNIGTETKRSEKGDTNNNWSKSKEILTKMPSRRRTRRIKSLN